MLIRMTTQITNRWARRSVVTIQSALDAVVSRQEKASAGTAMAVPASTKRYLSTIIEWSYRAETRALRIQSARSLYTQLARLARAGIVVPSRAPVRRTLSYRESRGLV
jgi:hypothetical protein